MERDEGLSRLAAKDEPEKTARTMQPTYRRTMIRHPIKPT